MTIDVTVLEEMWTILKQYIPQKDRQEAADNLMSVMVDMLGDAELAEFSTVDNSLSKAFKEYGGEPEEYEEEGDDEDW